jgi:hypothetical protein
MSQPRTIDPWEPARWALLSGVLGVIANLLLIAFYALSQPWQPGERPYGWVGATNDVFVTAQYAALVPVGFALRAALQRHQLRWVAWLGIAAMMLVVLLQALLLVGVMKFNVEGIAVSLCLAVAFGWMLAVVRTGNRERVFSGRLATFGTALGVTFVMGLALVGLALLLPKWSVPQYAAFGIGGAFGLFAWLGFPLWLVWARSRLSQLGN